MKTMQNNSMNGERKNCGFESAMDAFGVGLGRDAAESGKAFDAQTVEQPAFAYAMDAFGMAWGRAKQAVASVVEGPRSLDRASFASAMRAFGTGWRNSGRRAGRAFEGRLDDYLRTSAAAAHVKRLP